MTPGKLCFLLGEHFTDVKFSPFALGDSVFIDARPEQLQNVEVDMGRWFEALPSVSDLLANSRPTVADIFCVNSASVHAQFQVALFSILPTFRKETEEPTTTLK